MSGIFTAINDLIDSQMTELVKITQTNIANSIADILSVSIIAYLTFYGYMILADKVQSPLKSVFWKCVSFAIIIAFLQNSGGILTLAGEAVEEISTIGSNNAVGFSYFDELYLKMYGLANKLWDKGGMFTGAVGFLGVMLGWGVLTVPVFLIFVVSKFTLFLLLGFAPFFIFCLMWGWLKQSFSNYLSALLGNAFILLVIRTIQTAIVDFFKKFLSYDNVAAPALAGILVCISAIVLAFLTVHIIKTVSKLMTVTVDQLPALQNGKTNAEKQAEKQAQQLSANREAKRDQVQQQILQQLKELNKNK